MPEINKQKKADPKKRLGRGLGSLLSTDMQNFSANNQNPVPKQKVAKDSQVTNEAKAPAIAKEKSEVPAEKVVKKAFEASPKAPAIDDKNRIWHLDIDKVEPNRRQPRKDFDKDPLEELAASIKEQGILQPITVRKVESGYEIIAGERRWRAAQVAGLHQVPVIIKEVDDQKVMELALIENIQRENLNPVEEAIAYQQLIDDYSLSQQEVAQKVGKERTTITNSLRILTLPKEAKRALRQKTISVGHAKVLLSVTDPKRQLDLLKMVITKKLSVRALEKEAKKKEGDENNLDNLDVSGRLAQSLASDLQVIMGTKVNISYSRGKGKIEISYYSDDELTRYCEKIKESWNQDK